MTDVTPPHPPHPKQVAKGVAGVFKNKPAWVWVAGVTVLVGVAYFVWRNGRSASVADTGTAVPVDPMDATTGPVAGNYGYDSSLVPSATQGAYGGYDYPVATAAPAPVDSAGTPEVAPLVSITIPGPVDNSTHSSGTGSAKVGKPVTGGGHPPRNPAGHKPVPNAHDPRPTPAQPKKWEGHLLAWWKVPANAKRNGKWRWPGEQGYRHSRAFEGNS